MINYKIIVSFITVILTFVGYVPYIRDIFKNKTKPHTFTFLVWTIAGFIGYGLQVFGGAGVGAWTLLLASVLCFFIFILSLWKGEKHITISDIVFLILSFVSLYLWLVVNQPVWSVILATTVDLFGFLPTIRKSWDKPYSETLFTYQVCVFRHSLSILALQRFNILTLLYPIVWTAANLAFWIVLASRRKKIKEN